MPSIPIFERISKALRIYGGLLSESNGPLNHEWNRKHGLAKGLGLIGVRNIFLKNEYGLSN